MAVSLVLALAPAALLHAAPRAPLSLAPRAPSLPRSHILLAEGDAPAAELGEDGLTDKQREAKRLREAEVFMTKETGVYVCRTCGYAYDPEKGDGLLAKPGTAFADLDESWRCPQCQSPKPFFESQTLTIAGFEENQQFGFGGNSMTEGQKSNLIFGGLFVAFLLLMSGYLLT